MRVQRRRKPVASCTAKARACVPGNVSVYFESAILRYRALLQRAKIRHGKDRELTIVIEVVGAQTFGSRWAE